MAVTRADIIFLLSGGSTNSDPNQSLGGPPSTKRISGDFNNLFDDISESDAQVGHIDYRCFYVKNNSSETWENVRVWMADQSEGAIGLLGLDSQDDTQQLTVISDNGANGGNFKVDFDGDEVQVDYDADINTWADNFQTALRTLSTLSDVTVTGQEMSGAKEFELFMVTFTGDDGAREQPTLFVTENNLTFAGGGTGTIDVTKTNKGTPINNTPAKLGEETVAPINVSFQVTSESTFVTLGNLNSGDFVPIWIQRIFPAGNAPVVSNTFTVILRGAS
jgi:hypothetical protein